MSPLSNYLARRLVSSPICASVETAASVSSSLVRLDLRPIKIAGLPDSGKDANVAIPTIYCYIEILPYCTPCT